MRSRRHYIVKKDDVHGYANHWLATALRFEYEGRKCTGETLILILLIAAARTVSIFAACRSLADAPTDQTIRNALGESLPEMLELERRLNRALVVELPKAVRRRSRMIAIDLTLIPYHGRPFRDEKEVYRGSPKSGTTHFHAYATAVVLHKGHRYTLALTRVERGEKMKDVVKRLLATVRRRGVKTRLLVLDKGFFNVDLVSYLNHANYRYIIPAVPRGRKPKVGKRHVGLRGFLRKRNGYYPYTMTNNARNNQRTAKVTICVASKSYLHKKTGKRRWKKLLYVVRKVRLTPQKIRELYRKRFGIETSYRQMNQARIRTCTRDPRQRLLFVGIALVLRNVWVWLHFTTLAKNKWDDEPTIFLELLRFEHMLKWIEHVIERLLRADLLEGLTLETYERLTAHRR